MTVPTAFWPGLMIKLASESTEQAVVLIVAGLNERVVVAAAPLRVVVWLFTRYKTTGIAKIKNAKFPNMKNLFLNNLMVYLTK